MSKRGAEEYITKEHGSTPNDPSEGAKVKMATAAQMAKRKMAVPKSRAGRTGQSPMPGAGSSNPFASTNPFGASQNNQQQTIQNPGGVTFGASQSFPPGESSGSGFNFSVPGQSSSFTFGQPVGNNPFATLNGNASSQPRNQESNDTIMESPQKKPAFGTSLFGSSNTDQSTQSTGFKFGQSTNQPASQSGFSFGQTQGFGSASNASPFGQNTSQPPETTSTTLFGQTTDASNRSSPAPAFGQSPGIPQQTTQTSGFTFGQPATSAPSSASTFSFGQPTTSAPPSSGFSFGQPATSAPAAASTFGFGQPSPQSVTGGSLFGGDSQASESAFGKSTPASQPTATTSLFGAPSSRQTDNAFGGFGSPKLASASESKGDSATTDQSKPSPFGKPDTSTSKDSVETISKSPDKPKANPFAGLFAQSPSTEAQTNTGSGTDARKPLFNFTTPAQPSGLFALPKDSQSDSAPKSSEEIPKKPLFSFGTSTTQPSANAFSQSESVPKTSPVKANPFADFSEQQSEATGQITNKPMFGSTNESKGKSESGFQPLPSFGSTPISKQPSGTFTSTPKAFGDLGKSQPPNFAPAANQSPEDTVSRAATTSLFGSATIPTSKEVSSSSTDLFTKTAEAAAAAVGRASATGEGTLAAGDVKKAVNTHPPTRIPPYLNGDDYKAYDSNYRLHSLNREFQKHIASLDPSRNDFENIIRNYVAARESIGESIGLYTRNVAGMKRKTDEEDNTHSDGTNTTKKPKNVSEPLSKSQWGSDKTSVSAFPPVPSSSVNPSAMFGGSPTASTTKPGAPNASSLFGSTIPNDLHTSASTASSNPFANLSNSGSTSKADLTPKPTFSFGQPAATPAPAGSTTPIKSPPKQPAFEMPKFAAPVGGMNFMDAFKKQSETSAAKFAKEAKEKRKAEDFDSDEDDEEEWNRKYEEEEKTKKAKIEAITQKGFTPSLANGTSASAKPLFSFGPSSTNNTTASQPSLGLTFGNKDVGKSAEKPIDISDNDASGEEEEEGSGDSGDGDGDGDEEDGTEVDADEDDLPEDVVNAEDDNEEDEDLETTMARTRSKGKSLFDRVTPNPSSQKESTSSSALLSGDKHAVNKPTNSGNMFGKGSPDPPSLSSLTPASSKEPYVPSKTFNFTPTPPVASPTPVAGASIFAGGLVKDGPIMGEGLFGSRPSTPSNAEKPKANIFGNLGTPSFSFGTDHTWKKGSEIKFGTSTTEAPSVSITQATPRKDETRPFGTLFGAASSTTNPPGNESVGFNFGQNPAPGFLSAASHLAAASGTNSGVSSRATSPGTTDNESVATNDEDYSHDTQVSLMENRPGEENEKVLFESRARVMRHYSENQTVGTKFNQGWNSVGLGIARLLKHKETGKTRLVIRAEPGANILLNTNLQAGIEYRYTATGNAGSVTFSVITNEGAQLWLVKTKTQQQAQDLAKLMEENKKSAT